MEEDVKGGTAVAVPNFIESKVAEAANRLQSGYLMARRFPRNEEAAVTRINRECQRWALADEALYKYERAETTIVGPTIRLMEVIAQAWGNLSFGVQELENISGPEGYSIIEGYCTDLETNNHHSKTFKVYHKVLVGKKGNKWTKVLVDPRDIYEHVANQGARRMRSAIQACVPRYVVDQAIEQVKRTLGKGPDNKSLKERIDELVKAFADLGVSVEMLEKRLDHAVKDLTADELVDLRIVYKTLYNREGNRKEFFSLRDDADEGGGADKLKSKLAQEPEVAEAELVGEDNFDYFENNKQGDKSK